jgi:hypothetical protein
LPARPNDLVLRRLHAQRVATTAFTRPAEVVAWLGAVQAQDYLGALWGVGLRLVSGAREHDVERALAERSIVRSWPMRGTLHFLAAADARWMIALLAPRAAGAAKNRLERMGIDAEVLARARRALVRRLEGGRSLTRAAAYQVLARARVPTEGQRGLHVLWRLAHEGLVCFGARRGKQQTFVLLEEWLPRAKGLARDEAMPELARRYFTSHGPATLRDFAWWSGMKLADARLATNMSGSLLEQEVIDGKTHWFAPAPTPRAKARAHALPAFDELFVGYADRSAAVEPAYAKRLGPFEILGPVVVLDGRIVATYKRRFDAGRVVFATKPVGPMSEAKQRDVRGALARYARFLGMPHAWHTSATTGL